MVDSSTVAAFRSFSLVPSPSLAIPPALRIPCLSCGLEFSIPSQSNVPVMLQEARADRGAINITLNSFGGPLNEPMMRTSDRKRLYPAIGALYPEATNSFQVRL